MLVTLLAHQAWLMTDAIVRTLFRLFVSRRRMLEWVTAAQAKFDDAGSIFAGSIGGMAGGVALRCRGRGHCRGRRTRRAA